MPLLFDSWQQTAGKRQSSAVPFLSAPPLSVKDAALATVTVFYGMAFHVVILFWFAAQVCGYIAKERAMDSCSECLSRVSCCAKLRRKRQYYRG